MKKVYFLLTTIFLFAASLKAADFGLLLDQTGGGGSTVSGGAEPVFDYRANLLPRISAPLGDSGGLLLQAGLAFGYDEEIYIIPELLRSEVALRFGAAKITAGRMFYSAPYVFIAEGLFDGLRFLYNGTAGTLDIGAWYTGLLYKKKATIIMTEDEYRDYYTAVDFDNFADTYFASRRAVAALGWETPALADLLRAKIAVIAQADLNGGDNFLHSQYFTTKIGIPLNSVMFELGGVLELMEAADDLYTGLAGELRFLWTLPSQFPGRFSLTGTFFGHRAESGSLTAFIPVTTRFYGNILQARPSGISMLELEYNARLHGTFSLGVSSAYFIRGDLGTYVHYPVDKEATDGYFLGNEFFARLKWSPVSDLQMGGGGGIFLPVTGNAAPGREPRWRAELSAILALY